MSDLTPEPRYFFGQDDSGHWYLVRAENRDDWNAWMSLPDDDERGWACPVYASRIDGGPGWWTFQRPRKP